MKSSLIKILSLALGLLSFSQLSHAQVVQVDTNLGSFEITLDAENAPKTVANFLRYVDDGSYSGSLFHRVIPKFMAQGGGYTADYENLPSYPPIENESSNGLSNTRGSIAMARTNDPNSATRQFFINVVDNAHLDGSKRRAGYTVFGEVTKGMEIVDIIVKQPTKNGPLPGMANVPQQKVIIEQVIRLDAVTADE
ncbi:peptidylprolyl isomerase [Aliagarivorans taiwanensis]|uniref:peptidylprolyl isomerase n=1 Tax=Aliagarivorans taiwanensis TaxID=561966 RepID=UPI0004177EF0|nr:peptidylprolyl isomerase [Aliagarivorans taiwanensis]